MTKRRQAVVALIRGINLGPRKKVSMPALREALSEHGFDSVRTHLNSGNVVVVGTSAPASVGATVHDAMSEKLGVQADVIVRTADELAAVVSADPFGSIATDGSKHFVGFGNAPIAASVPEPTETSDDRAEIVDGHLYLWCPRGLSQSAYWKVNWDQALAMSTTMRNWNTVTRLLELARQDLQDLSR